MKPIDIIIYTISFSFIEPLCYGEYLSYSFKKCKK